MAMTEQAKRRVRAGRMLQKGKPVSEIAAVAGVSRQTVYKWKHILEEQGLEGLRSVNPGGRPGQLGEAEREQVYAALLQGATAHGFGSDLWTLKRVRQLIERECGIGYSEVHVWRLLGQLGFSSQKPERRALERDEAAIERWKRRKWPALKKSPARRARDRVYRRVGFVGAADPRAYLGADRPDPGGAVPLQLEAVVFDCGADAVAVLLPVARRHDQERTDCRVPGGAGSTDSPAGVDYLGRTESAPQPPGAGLCGQFAGCYPFGNAAGLCAGTESGGVSLGLAQASRLGQLLSAQPG